MLYWIIPYLVAYDANNSTGWKYGPEYVFKAEVNLITMDKNNPVTYKVYSFINFVCRPINSNLIECRIDSAWMKSRWTSFVREEFGLQGIVFQIEYDTEGISRVWVLNNYSTVYHNMVHAIIGTMHMGMNIVGKRVGHHVFRETSIIGTCDTSFIISYKNLSEANKLREIEIKGYTFRVPSFGPQTDNKTIVIKKNRHMSNCVKKTPYFFGDYGWSGQNSGVSVEHSQSQFNLGPNSFSASTRTLRTSMRASENESGSTLVSIGHEHIHVRLESIRPATVEQWPIENLVNAGAGFEPGTPWPGWDIES